MRFSVLVVVLLAIAPQVAFSQSNLPRVDLSNLGLQYKGAFRIKNETSGDGRIAFTHGEFTLTPGAKSFYISSNPGSLAVGQYSVPTLGPSAGEGASLNDVPPIVNLPLISTSQPYVSLKPKAESQLAGGQSTADIITGLEYTADDKLIVNWLEYYDADGSNFDTTLVVDDPSSLETSKAYGFHKLQKGSHLAGWASKVPAEWQDALDTNYLFGYASNYAINSRLSIGPSAFAVDVDALTADHDPDYSDTIPTIPYIDYSINHPLHEDQYNDGNGAGDGAPGDVGDNDVWTEVSEAQYGFIVPGTSTYMVVGFSGGHESGIGYKITQDNGNICGGPCARDYQDYYHYVWFYDVEDMLAVKDGTMQPYDVRPYSYGKLDLPYQPDPTDTRWGFYEMGGADYDAETNQLFILIEQADGEQGPFERGPLMLVYQLPETFTQVPEPVSLVSALIAAGGFLVSRRRR